MKFQNCGVFLRTNPERDQVGKNLAQLLKVDKYPTVSLIVPRADLIHETGRVTGYMKGDEFTPEFRKLLAQAAKESDAPKGLRENPLKTCPALGPQE